jgi:hypothetical protein
MVSGTEEEARMGLMSKKVFSGSVRLSGLPDEPGPSDVVAQVQFEAHGRPEQPRDMAAFLAKCLIANLRGSRSAPTHAEPCIDITGEVADALLSWNPDAGDAFRLRDVVDDPLYGPETLALMYDPAGPSEEMVDTWLRQLLPRVAPEPVGGRRRRFAATMTTGRRSGATFVKPSSRNSFLAIQGMLAMIEAAAQTRDWGTTVLPTAATLRRVLDFNREAFGGGIPDFGEATWLYELVDAVALAEDPLTSPLPQFSGTDSSGDEALAMVKLGRWMRESGLDEGSAAAELQRRTAAGEPMPWEEQGAG